VTILYCHCAYADIVPAATKGAVRAALPRADGRVECVADLCERAAARDPLLADLAAEADGPLHVVACYPRAVRWLFAFAGAPLAGSATVHNMRTEEAATILSGLGLPAADDAADTDGLEETARRVSAPAAEEDTDAADARRVRRPAALHARGPADAAPGKSAPDAWIAWYPVIDRDRCTGCKQCVEFCLFGTYAVDADGRVRVASPASCKLNCPACARVCPASAIIFPKFADGGFIAGDAGAAQRSAEDGLRSDLARLGHEDAYDVLRQRAARARAAAQAKYGRPKEADAE